MARKLPSYTQDNLTEVGNMTSQIAAAAARYGVPPEAIAGALAQELLLKNAMIAAQNGVPYVPQIGVDGAGATYLANEAAITQALADGPASFSDRWNATNDRARPAAGQRSVRNSAGEINDSAARADVQGPVDPQPGPPAYIPEFLRYLQNADRVPRTRPEDVRILRRMPAEDQSIFNSSDGVPVPFVPPDASFPLSPQSEFERRFGSWPPFSGGVLAGFNPAPQRQSDSPNNEDWSAMWRRRTGLP